MQSFIPLPTQTLSSQEQAEELAGLQLVVLANSSTSFFLSSATPRLLHRVAGAHTVVFDLSNVGHLSLRRTEAHLNIFFPSNFEKGEIERFVDRDVWVYVPPKSSCVFLKKATAEQLFSLTSSTCFLFDIQDTLVQSIQTTAGAHTLHAVLDQDIPSLAVGQNVLFVHENYPPIVSLQVDKRDIDHYATIGYTVWVVPETIHIEVSSLPVFLQRTSGSPLLIGYDGKTAFLLEKPTPACLEELSNKGFYFIDLSEAIDSMTPPPN